MGVLDRPVLILAAVGDGVFLLHMVGYGRSMKPSKITTITATEMQHKSGEIIRRAYTDNEHFIVERSGYPMVVIIPLAHYRALTDSGTSPTHHPDSKQDTSNVKKARTA